MHRPKKTSPTELPAPAVSPALTEAGEPAPRASKLATLITQLQAPEGATLASLCEATGWQSHSVRGALAGALKRKGYEVTSSRPEDGPRRYRIEASA